MLDVKNLTTTQLIRRTKTYRPNKFKVSARRYSVFLKTLVIVLVISFCFYYMYHLVFRSGRYEITEMSVEGIHTYVNENDLRNLMEGQVLGTNLLTLDTDHVASIIQDNFLGVRTTQVSKDYPKTVKISIEERVPVAVVCSSEEECFYIDNEGYVLGTVGEGGEDLPRIEYGNEILIGHFLEENIIPVSFEILDYASRYHVQVSSISYNPRYSELYIKNGVEILIGHSKKKSDALRIIASLLKKDVQESKNIRKIDL